MTCRWEGLGMSEGTWLTLYSSLQILVLISPTTLVNSGFLFVFQDGVSLL